MRHPSTIDLALHAGGDLGLIRRIGVALHVRRCERCASEAAAVSEARGKIRDAAAALAPSLDWSALASEMTANIRVGLEAGQCVDEPRRPARLRGLRWSLGAALASACLLLALGFAVNFPHDSKLRMASAFGRAWRGLTGHTETVSQEGVVLDASPLGATVTANGAALQMLAPAASGPVSVSVSLQDSVSARYVDADSGQVTIDKVYYEQ